MNAGPTIALVLQPHGVYYAYAYGHIEDTHCLATRCDPLACAWWAYRCLRIRSERSRETKESKGPCLPMWGDRPVYRWPRTQKLRYLMEDDVFFHWHPEDRVRWWRHRRVG